MKIIKNHHHRQDARGTRRNIEKETYHKTIPSQWRDDQIGDYQV